MCAVLLPCTEQTTRNRALESDVMAELLRHVVASAPSGPGGAPASETTTTENRGPWRENQNNDANPRHPNLVVLAKLR